MQSKLEDPYQRVCGCYLFISQVSFLMCDILYFGAGRNYRKIADMAILFYVDVFITFVYQYSGDVTWYKWYIHSIYHVMVYS